MIITAIAYDNEAQTMLKVSTSDEGVRIISNLAPGNSNRTYFNDIVDAWLAIVGHSISAWVDPVDYMAKLRVDRDQKIDIIYWRVERNQTQKAGSISPTDNDSKMTEIYTYLQTLRDFPAANPITTKTQYDALVWPNVPA